MGNEDDLPERLQTALDLDGSADSVRDFYAGWAGRYNSDTSDWHYTAPANAAQLLMATDIEHGVLIDPRNRNIRIMDAGCGTGQLGSLLREHGYLNIDGFDLSPEMIEIAERPELIRRTPG